MADTENSGGQGAAAEDRAPRQIVVHAQYIKDLSFENPNAPDILIEPPSQPDVEIGDNVRPAASTASNMKSCCRSAPVRKPRTSRCSWPS